MSSSSSMTRQHFKAIAEAVRFSNLEIEDKEHIAKMLSIELGKFNENFDKAKFLAACTEGA